jgi:hypothetical protein
MEKTIFTPDDMQGTTVTMDAAEEAAMLIVNTSIEDTLAAEAQKATDQANGNQKLLDLGLTQAEATALTGYVPPAE